MNNFPLNSDKSPATGGGNWKEYSGEVNTPLIGVPIPAGAVVFDLDTYKGVTIGDVETALGYSLEWDEALLQRTPKGGEHYAFNVPFACSIINGVDVLGVKGFDIRSSGKGYIATGAGYTDETMFGVIDTLHEIDLLPELPGDVVGLISAQVESVDDDLMSAIAAQPLDIADDEMGMYLAKLDETHAGDHDTWLRVMMGIYHQTGGSKAGYALFDTFSLLSPSNYNESKNSKRWNSLSNSARSNPVTFASIINLVGGREAITESRGVSISAQLEEAENRDDVYAVMDKMANNKLDEINEAILLKGISKKLEEIFGEKLTVAQVKKIVKSRREKTSGDFVDDYIFLTSIGEYMERATKVTMGPRSFDVKHNRDSPTDQDGNPQQATGYVNNIIECVHGGMYAPTFNGVFNYNGIDYFNTYKPTKLEPVANGKSGTVDKVIGHIEHLIDDEKERLILTSYLAHCVQFPGKKIHWALMLQGVEGDGKSFFAEMMKYMLGETNCQSIGAEVLEEQYTPWSEGNCLVVIEEVKMDNYRKYEVLNRLKPYITNPTISVRKMYTDVYEAVNTTNYLALTNFKDALPIGDNDRRYGIIFSRWQSKDKLEAWMSANTNYYSDLYESMRANQGELLHWLLNFNIPDWFMKLNRAPDTRAKQMMVDMAKSSDYLAVEDAINKFNCEDISDHVVNVTKLSRMATCTFEDDAAFFPKTSKIKNIMADMGYQPIGRYKDADRKNQVIYCKDDSRKAADFKAESVPN